MRRGERQTITARTGFPPTRSCKFPARSCKSIERELTKLVGLGQGFRHGTEYPTITILSGRADRPDRPSGPRRRRAPLGSARRHFLSLVSASGSRRLSLEARFGAGGAGRQARGAGRRGL